jgi:class 3 adenylate cyclase/tetratricopeptide (TPR) repeat protein
MTGLRRHIPELAIEWALDDPECRWKALDGTLCFADISGFTALAERLAQRGRVGGEELIETLSRVFGGMLERARARDGMLLKFGGDALLFLFKGQDHAIRAASAAVEMRQALRKAVEIPTSVGRLRLTMSVGLHSGQIHFFLVGSSHRELVLAGPGATIATDTEGAANAGQIAVSRAAAAALPASAVKSRDDGILLLRWRKAPTPAPGPSPAREVDPEIIRGLFPRLLGEALEPGPPEPEHRVACIAFVRFSGTDRLLKEEGPDAVAAALQATISTAEDMFVAEGVTLLAIDIDSDGGKLFLGSGVPLASEDDGGRMLRALRRVADAGTPLPLQFGVNRGHVFVAEVGTPWRAAYSAMGDTTNTAARICAKASPGMIFVHPVVLEHSRTLFATEPVGPFTFKGKKTPQVLYQIGDEIGTRGAHERGALPLVGRRSELRILEQAVSALAAGTGGVVSITGAAGLGKSRLLHEALQRLDGTPVIQLGAEPYWTTNPYRVLRDPIRSLLGIERADPAQMRKQLEAGAARLDPALVPLLALLGDVAQIEVELSTEVAAIEPQFRPDRVADTVIELLAAAHPGPLVIAMEDAQWADEASSRLLERVARVCEQRSWLMLVARRNDEGGFTSSVGMQLSLEPLAPDGIEKLVIAATAASPLRPDKLALVVRRAGGNPLFAEEIIKTAREVGSLEAVPDSLEGVLAAQVDALDPTARHVLRHATVLGRSFRRSTLETLLASEGRGLDPATLSRLDGFIEPHGEDRLRFRNGLLRKTIYEGLAYRLRNHLHRVAGESIESLAADPNASADRLALHFSLAGDAERTWRYARVAADRARQAYANPEAARLYQMALDAGRRLPDVGDADRLRVWTELGEVRDRAGMFDEALDAYRRASRLVRDDPIARAKLLLRRAYVRERAGAFSAALRELTTAKRLIAELDLPEARKIRAKLSSFAAMIRFAQEHFGDALSKAEAAIEEARRASNKAALAEALVVAGSAHDLLGTAEPEQMLEALAIFEELGDLSSEAMVRGNLGCSAYFFGRWDEALTWWNSQRETCLRAGHMVGEATAASNIGEILVKRGLIAEAEPMLRDAIRVMQALGFTDGAAYAEIQLARILIERGAHEEAEILLERVGAEFSKLGQATSALESALVQSLAMVRAGRASGALDLLDRATRAAGEDASLFEPQVAEARARALAALGRFNDAEQEIERGIVAARDLNLAYEQGMLLRARTEIARAADVEPNPSDLSESERILGDLGIRPASKPSIVSADSIGDCI